LEASDEAAEDAQFEDMMAGDDGSRDWSAILAMPLGLVMHLFYVDLP
jgi:hypothetical protein